VGDGSAAAAEAAWAAAGASADIVLPLADSQGSAASEEPPAPALVRLSTLESFLEKSRPEERAKAKRARLESTRYYVAAEVSGELAASARTDDGYLTRAGARLACAVCCRSGHKVWDCPETRCFFCFSTGHAAKKCPRALEKCDRCGKRGHAKEACLWDLLVDAARSKLWADVRCVRCGESGHPMCMEPEEERAALEAQGDAARAAARAAAAVGAALTGRRFGGGGGSGSGSGGASSEWNGSRSWSRDSTGSGAGAGSGSGSGWRGSRDDAQDGPGRQSWQDNSKNKGLEKKSSEKNGWESKGSQEDAQARSGSQSWHDKPKTDGWEKKSWEKTSWESKGWEKNGWDKHGSEPGNAKASKPREWGDKLDVRSQLRAKMAQQNGRNGLQGAAQAKTKDKQKRRGKS